MASNPNLNDDGYVSPLAALATQQPVAPVAGGGPARDTAPAPTPAPTEAGSPRASSAFSEVESAVGGAVDSATAGLAPYAYGAMDLLLPSSIAHRAHLANAADVFEGNKSFGDALAGNIARHKQVFKDAESDNWKSYLGGQIAGGVLVPYGSGAKGALQVAKVGGVLGGVYGAAHSDSLSEVPGNVAEGVATGAATGYIGDKVLGAVSSGVRKLLGRSPGAEGATSTDAAVQGEEGVPPVPPSNPTEVVPSNNAPIGGLTQDGLPVLQGDVTTREPSDVANQTPGTGAQVDGAGTAGDAAGVRGGDGAGNGGDNAVAPPGDGGAGGGDGASAHPSNELVPLGEHPEGGPHATMARDQLDALQGDVEGWLNKLKVEGDRAADTASDHPTGQWRMGATGDVPNVAALLRSLTESLQPKGTFSQEDMHKAASTAGASLGDGVDGPMVVAWMQDLLGHTDLTDPTAIARGIAVAKATTARAAQQITEHSLLNIDWSTATPDLVESAANNIRHFTSIAQMLANVKTGWGRGGQALSMPSTAAYEAALRDKLPLYDNAPGTGIIPPVPTTADQIGDYMDLWKMGGGDLNDQMNFATGNLKPPTPGKYLWTQSLNHFTANILSSTATLLRNLTGPTFVNTYRSIARMVAPIDPTMPAELRQAAWAQAQATPKAMMSMLADVGDVFRQVAHYSNLTLGGVSGEDAADMASAMGRTDLLQRTRQAFLDNRKVIGGNDILDGDAARRAFQYGPLTPNLLKAANIAPDWRYSLGNLISVWPRAFSKLNNGLDEFATRLTYYSLARTNATVEAKLAGLGDAEAQAHIQNAMQGATDDLGRATDHTLLDQAESSTFTYSPRTQADGLRNKTLDALQYARREIPISRILLPVLNIPANVLGATLSNTGIARLAARDAGGEVTGFGRVFERDAANLNGDNGQLAQAEAHGRMMLGASLMIAGGIWNSMGIATGAGPQDPGDRKTWLDNDMRPYSFHIGDTWVPYAKIDLIGGLLGIMATAHDATIYHRQDEGVSDMVLSGLGATMQWLKDQGSMQNVAALMGVGSDPTNSVGGFATKIAGSAASGMLLPRLITAPAVPALDPHQRLKEHWYDYLTAATPMLSQRLMPVRNVLGEPVNRPPDAVAQGFLPVTFGSVNPKQADPVMEELARLSQSTGYSGGADPNAVGGGNFDPREVTLKNGQTMMDALLQARQSYEIGGKTLRQSLTSLIDSNAYKHATELPDAGIARTSLGQLNKTYMIAHTFSAYTRGIKGAVANDRLHHQGDSTVADYLTASAAKDRNGNTLGGVSTDDLVGNPALYSAHGINQHALQRSLLGASSSQRLLDAIDQ